MPSKSQPMLTLPDAIISVLWPFLPLLRHRTLTEVRQVEPVRASRALRKRPALPAIVRPTYRGDGCNIRIMGKGLFIGVYATGSQGY